MIASGGMSHFPGTWKYPKPDYDFDYWAIAQMEKGNHEALLNLTSSSSMRWAIPKCFPGWSCSE